MTNLPDDLVSPLEGALARRIRSYSEQAVVPIDAMAIASTVAAGARPSPGRFGRAGVAGRLVLVGATAALITVGGIYFGAGGTIRPSTIESATPASSARSSSAPSPAAPDGIATCESTDLSGRIFSWDGAAGSRIATVSLANEEPGACRLANYELALVDGGGRGTALIIGPAIHPELVIEGGATVHTVIEASNFCPSRPYTPNEPVSIRLDAVAEGAGDVVLAPADGSMSGVPPCNGPAGSAGSISQQPWQQGPPPTR
ncbi:MAG TPA: hypothetical protein VFP56_00500 [Candidatus Limnocylindrales bacterium]|nr:hypothetical protein [Candidatus Limnocylindrales bacterium]